MFKIGYFSLKSEAMKFVRKADKNIGKAGGFARRRARDFKNPQYS